MKKYRNKVVHILDLIFTIIGIGAFLFIAILLIDIMITNVNCQDETSCNIGYGIGIALLIVFIFIAGGYGIIPLALSIFDKKTVGKRINPLLIINSCIELFYVVTLLTIIILN